MAPFAGFEDWGDCIETMTEEDGHDEDSAEDICGALQAEHKSGSGDAEALLEALQRGSGLIADVGVDLVSGVDVPAVDSKWVMTKSGGGRKGHDYRAQSPIVLSKADDDSEDQRISYAAAMIPREPDKEGDVVATPTVEKAAHGFLKQDGGVDTDHSLIDGEGTVVESWVLKDERTFDLPGGESETYGAGTWMVGIEWGAEAWDRIKSGELTGLSIYGMAEQVPLSRAASGCGCSSATAKQLDIPLAAESVVHLVYESRTAAEKASDQMGLDGRVHEHEFDGMTVFMPGDDHQEFVDRYMELSEESDGEVAASLTTTNHKNADTHKGDGQESAGMGSDQQTDGDGGDAAGDGTGDGGPTLGEVAASVESLQDTVADVTETVDAVKEAVDTEKQDAREAADILADEMGYESGEEVLDTLARADDEDDMDEDEDDEMEASAGEGDDGAAESAAKRADDANLGKGADGRQTAAKAHDSDDAASSDDLSYQALAENRGGSN